MKKSKVVISGNIGAGKTTFVQWLASKKQMTVYEEEASTNPLLPLFYENPEKWGFAMQVHMLRTRMETTRKLLEIDSEMGCVQDRSVFEDGLFVEANKKQGQFHDLLYNEYKELFTVLTKDLHYPDLFIYLYATPEECATRILVRGRECEKNMSLNYLKALHTEYENFFDQKCKEVPVIIVNSNKLDVNNDNDSCYELLYNFVDKYLLDRTRDVFDGKPIRYN